MKTTGSAGGATHGRRARIWLVAVAALALVACAWAVAWAIAPEDSGEAVALRAPATPTPGPSPGATAVPGSEVPPPSADPALGGVPPLEAPPALIDEAPPAASAEGRLVEGYPAEVAGPLESDEVTVSGVTSEGDTVQASLTARSDRSADEVRAAYRERWAALGLSPSDADAAGETPGDAPTTFSGPSGSVSLVAAESGTGTVYRLYAVLRTS